MSKEINIQCECGLCCGTLTDWKNHSKPSGHLTYKIKTIQEITKKTLNEINKISIVKQAGSKNGF